MALSCNILRMQQFRLHHLFTFFEAYDKGTEPLDLALHRYFRAHKALGAKDRAFLAETVYALMRWRGLLDALCIKPITWESRLAVLGQEAPEDLPPHTYV